MEIVEQRKPRARARGVVKKPAVPGGKALRRAQLFALQRGLEGKPEVKGQGLVRQTKHAAATGKGKAVRSTARAFLVAAKKRAKLPVSATALPVWRELGPREIPKGQTYGTGGNNRPPVSGRISGVAVHPENFKHILVASAGGGLWSTKDLGNTWAPLTDFQPTLSMGAVVFAPSNPNFVYAGTGEGDTFSQLGVGLLRSTDAGSTWTLISNANFVGQAFFDIAVDPTNHLHLFAAMTNGLFESQNGGTTWVQRRSSLTWDVSIHPAGNGEILAACQDGLFRSTDNGTIWSKVVSVASTALQRMEVVHAPSNGDIVFVFLSAGGVGRLYRRATMGGAFVSQTLPAGLNVSQSWYDWCAAVAPRNPNVLYLGAIDLYRGVRSNTGNWSWKNISSRSTGDSIHPDQHFVHLQDDALELVYAANDGGLYFSRSGGNSWASLNKGLGITEFEFIAQHPSNLTWILGGTQDNGTLRLQSVPVWEQSAFGDGGDCGVNNDTPTHCYHSYYGLGFEFSTSGGNFGAWTYVAAPTGVDALFYPPLEVRGTLVVQGGARIFITEDDGATWAQPLLPSSQVASALCIRDANSILVGTTQGSIFRVSRSGGTWSSPVALSMPRAGFVSDIHVDANGRIWATYSTILGGGHVFVSKNGGTSWTNRSSGLPVLAFNAIVTDPVNANIVYAGADNGVYRSIDGGKSWADFSAGLPNAIVGDLLFHAARRRLRAGTRNRGVWEVTV